METSSNISNSKNSPETDEMSNDGSKEATSHSDDAVKNDGENKSEDSIINETFLPNLAQGKIKQCGFTLDEKITMGEIVEQLGTPEYEDYLDGGYGRLYGDCVYSAEDEELSSTLTTLMYSSEKSQLTPGEVKSILGAPVNEGIDEMDGSFMMSYESGNYSATLYFENENAPIKSIFIK